MWILVLIRLVIIDHEIREFSVTARTRKLLLVDVFNSNSISNIKRVKLAKMLASRAGY